EWPKGSDCKSDGSAFEGSNPSPSTILFILLSSKVEGYSHQTNLAITSFIALLDNSLSLNVNLHVNSISIKQKIPVS
ncbi:hypothetical protein, partial [uncultured Shewanella sp.]|uniref:hypothetical protein n=1 Tax=uncultured Shewanella sp. TaxID=173975 RepID=UPI002628C412